MFLRGRTMFAPTISKPEFHKQPEWKIKPFTRFFFCICRRKRKSYKKENADIGISRSAERDKGGVPLTSAPFEKGARKLYWGRSKPLMTSELFRSAFFSSPAKGIDKNAQNRRISVSSPYMRTAETDFGERKSEFNKTQKIRARISCLPYADITEKFKLS